MWLDKAGSKENHRRGQRHERDTASATGGRTTAASGARPGHKSDVVGSRDDYGDRADRIECKATSRKSMSIKLAWWEKIETEAAESGREPVLAIRFERTGARDVDLVVIDRNTYLELINDG